MIIDGPHHTDHQCDNGGGDWWRWLSRRRIRAATS